VTTPTITPNDVAELVYRLVGCDCADYAIAYAPAEGGGLTVETEAAAKHLGHEIICGYDGLIGTDHTDTPLEKWDEEMFRLTAQVLNNWEPERQRQQRQSEEV
jgi:hypothetical protein